MEDFTCQRLLKHHLHRIEGTSDLLGWLARRIDGTLHLPHGSIKAAQHAPAAPPAAVAGAGVPPHAAGRSGMLLPCPVALTARHCPEVSVRAPQALARRTSAAECLRPPAPAAGQRSSFAAGVGGPLSAAEPPRPRVSSACQALAGDGDDGGWGAGGSGGDDGPSGGGGAEGPDGEGDDSVLSLVQVPHSLCPRGILLGLCGPCLRVNCAGQLDLVGLVNPPFVQL